MTVASAFGISLHLPRRNGFGDYIGRFETQVEFTPSLFSRSCYVPRAG